MAVWRPAGASRRLFVSGGSCWDVVRVCGEDMLKMVGGGSTEERRGERRAGRDGEIGGDKAVVIPSRHDRNWLFKHPLDCALCWVEER